MPPPSPLLPPSESKLTDRLWQNWAGVIATFTTRSDVFVVSAKLARWTKADHVWGRLVRSLQPQGTYIFWDASEYSLYDCPTLSPPSCGHCCLNCPPPASSQQPLRDAAIHSPSSIPASFSPLVFVSPLLQPGSSYCLPTFCHFGPRKLSLKPLLTLSFPEWQLLSALHPLFNCGCLRRSWLNSLPQFLCFFPGALCYLWLSSYLSCDLLSCVLPAPFNSLSALCFYLTPSIPSLLTVADSRECL